MKSNLSKHFSVMLFVGRSAGIIQRTLQSVAFLKKNLNVFAFACTQKSMNIHSSLAICLVPFGIHPLSRNVSVQTLGLTVYLIVSLLE